jgi:threonine/homoserine/homoserine lactone efflux protein
MEAKEMDIADLIAFTGISVMLTLMPGPDILFVIAQSVTHSRRDGIAVALGLCTGLVVHTTAAVWGVSALLYHSSVAFQVLKWAGAFYLFVLAWQALREAEETGEADQPPVRRQRFAALYRRGILMNLLNPKVSLFFLAFFPQFVSPDTGSVSWQMMILGAVFTAQALLVFSAVSVIAHRIGRNVLKSATSSKWVSRTKAGIYALLGARLVFMERE